MSKHKGDSHGRDVGLIGEHHEKVAGYNSPMRAAVEKMLEGDMPTTNLGTIAAGGNHGGHHRSVECEQKSMVEGKHALHSGRMKHDEPPRHKKHFAAGGVGKVRKGEY